MEILLKIINENYGALLVATGLLSTYYLIKNYEKNNAPLIAFDSFDIEKQTVKITNNGKGDAVNIKILPYTVFINNANTKKPEELNLRSKELGFLASGEKGEIKMIGSKVTFLYQFGHYETEDPLFYSRTTPILIEYKNPRGKGFLTKVIIKEGEFSCKYLGHEWLIRRKCRELIDNLNRDRILFSHRAKYVINKICNNWKS